MKELKKFSDVLPSLLEGKRVGKKGQDTFVFKQVHADISLDIVPKMQSLPQSVKDEFMRRKSIVEAGSMTPFNPELLDTIRYRNQFCIVYPDNTIQSWTPTPADICAEDWVILD